jgi:hypothetical protein
MPVHQPTDESGGARDENSTNHELKATSRSGDDPPKGRVIPGEVAS